RTIFEEAAGVLKYKQRKKEAESKLEETEANLNRVDDIIHEIEQQIHPLKKQAETAQQYLDLKEQKKEQEVSLLVTEIEQLRDEEHTSELQSRFDLVCRLLLEKKKTERTNHT